MSATSASHFIDPFVKVLCNTDNLFEGVFWGSWCGLNIHNWTQARNEAQKVQKLPESPEKVNRLWNAKKNQTLSAFSVVSGFSMVTSWMHDAGLITLGALNPCITSLGYGGSSIVSFSKVWDTLREIDQGIIDFNKAGGPLEKSDLALKQLENLLKVACFACFAAWGALGVFHTLLGGEALFFAMDTALYYGLVFLLAFLGASITLPLLKYRS